MEDFGDGMQIFMKSPGSDHCALGAPTDGDDGLGGSSFAVSDLVTDDGIMKTPRSDHCALGGAMA
jgi:hypothetical protein